MHPFVKLAKKAIETWVKERWIIPAPKELKEKYKEKAGVFVSIKKKGKLRGCIGTFLPTQESVIEEIIRNAIEAATYDPRFPPITPDELDEIEVSVDVLSEPEPVSDISQLDPKEYGIIVEKDGRRGLLLPDLEGVDSVEKQLSIAMYKAGIFDPTNMRIYRFKVKRYKEKE